MVVAKHHDFSFELYLQVEEDSGVKHEFLEGAVWAMSGGSPEHAAIAANVIALLSSQLRGRPCRVFSSDLRVQVLATGLTTYPDVTVICGRVELHPEDRKQQTATNPKLLVEVLSPTTEAYDRGEKLAHYKRIESVEEIILVAQDERRLERWRREADRWTLDVFHADESAELRSVGCAVPLPEVYRDPLA
jgi:Uma2 family endonuclease